MFGHRQHRRQSGARGDGLAAGARVPSCSMSEQPPQDDPERSPEQDPPKDSDLPEVAARRPWPRRSLQGLLAFVVYLVGSLLIWGGSTLAHLSTYYIPRQDSPDSDFFRWAFAWTPWALTHGRSPLFSDVVF